MCLGVFVGCSTYKIRDDYHYETMTIYFKDGENISFRRNDIKISQTDTLLIIDKKNDRSYVYKKENIQKIIYAWQNTKTVLQWSITHKKGVAYDF